MYCNAGTELCTVVETMFSFEVLFSILGDPVFAERAEKLAYNSLPATITSDMWAHQYLQQGNEMNAVHSDDHIWTHDGPDSTLSVRICMCIIINLILHKKNYSLVESLSVCVGGGPKIINVA